MGLQFWDIWVLIFFSILGVFPPEIDGRANPIWLYKVNFFERIFSNQTLAELALIKKRAMHVGSSCFLQFLRRLNDNEFEKKEFFDGFLHLWLVDRDNWLKVLINLTEKALMYGRLWGGCSDLKTCISSRTLSRCFCKVL